MIWRNVFKFFVLLSMSCVSPILVRSSNGVVLAPCGRCMSCCIAKQSALEFICKKEIQKVYSEGRGCSFCTLTYNSDNIPLVDHKYKTLVKSHAQKFLKRVRYYASEDNIPEFKFVLCGEYGDDLGRPHYHVVFFGLTDFLAKRYIYGKSWKYGFPQIGSLRSGGLHYVLKYMTKSRKDRELEQFYDSVNVQKPFILHSQCIGRDWILSHAKELADNDFCFTYKGRVRLLPKNVRTVVEAVTGVSARPAVDKYMRGIDTKGETLDNYLARRVYNSETNMVADMRLHLKPVSLPVSLRRPVELRETGNPTDFKRLAETIVFGDTVPF